MKPQAVTVALLTASNIFMTFAWYAHLRNLRDKPWFIAAIASWGIALFEYLLQVPANRIGSNVLRLDQLKLIQEVITLSVFVPFSIFYMHQPIRLNFLWAALCLAGAVFFIFRARGMAQRMLSRTVSCTSRPSCGCITTEGARGSGW